VIFDFISSYLISGFVLRLSAARRGAMEHEYDLIRQIILGNSDLFEQIVLEYQNLIFTICLNIVKNHSDAENMAQETFLAAYCSLTDFQGGNFKSWLCRIAVNKSIDFKRKQTKVVFVEYESSESKIYDKNIFEEEFEKKEQLDNILAGIPEKYSLVIKAFYYSRLPVKEIARQLKLPEKTVTTQLYRAKKLIKERWGENGT
jgi:RNA polymerase sigma-70 factor (ECF subfamily)